MASIYTHPTSLEARIAPVMLWLLTGTSATVYRAAPSVFQDGVDMMYKSGTVDLGSELRESDPHLLLCTYDHPGWQPEIEARLSIDRLTFRVCGKRKARDWDCEQASRLIKRGGNKKQRAKERKGKTDLSRKAQAAAPVIEDKPEESDPGLGVIRLRASDVVTMQKKDALVRILPDCKSFDGTLVSALTVVSRDHELRRRGRQKGICPSSIAFALWTGARISVSPLPRHLLELTPPPRYKLKWKILGFFVHGQHIDETVEVPFELRLVYSGSPGHIVQTEGRTGRAERLPNGKILPYPVAVIPSRGSIEFVAPPKDPGNGGLELYVWGIKTSTWYGSFPISLQIWQYPDVGKSPDADGVAPDEHQHQLSAGEVTSADGDARGVEQTCAGGEQSDPADNEDCRAHRDQLAQLNTA